MILTARGVHRAGRGRQFLRVRSRVGVRVPVRDHRQCPAGPARSRSVFRRSARPAPTPQTATITLAEQCPRSPPVGRRFRALTTSSNLSGQPARAHDHHRPQRHPVLRRVGRRPLLLRHPGLQPLRRLGARGRSPIPALLSAAGTASRAITHMVIAFSFPVSFFGHAPQQRARRGPPGCLNPIRHPRKPAADRPCRATPASTSRFIPFPLKDVHNRASTVDDAKGRFAASIVATLTGLGTNPPISTSSRGWP